MCERVTDKYFMDNSKFPNTFNKHRTDFLKVNYSCMIITVVHAQKNIFLCPEGHFVPNVCIQQTICGSVCGFTCRLTNRFEARGSYLSFCLRLSVSVLQDILAYQRRSTHRLAPGLYLGYLKLSSSVDQIKVLVSQRTPNMLCHTRIRDNANVSRYIFIKKTQNVPEFTCQFQNVP